MRTTIPLWVASLFFLAVSVASPLAMAANTITVATVMATAGESDVVVPISATTDARPQDDDALTLLSFDVTFDPALCGMITNQRLRRADRTVDDPLEGGVLCPDGKARFVFFSLVGAPVIDEGFGSIAEWVFDVRADAAGGVFPLGITIDKAQNGPALVPLEVEAGQISIEPAAAPSPTGTATSTATPTVTATPTASATPTATGTPESTPTPTPSATPTASATETPTASPSVTGTPTVPATPAPTVTPDTPLHLLDPTTAKAAAKCQGEINKSAGAFLRKKLKRLAKCTNAAFKCIQAQPADKRAGCLGKAGKTCGKELAKISDEERKLTARIVGKCAALGPDDLSDAAGLGFGQLEAVCHLEGSSTVEDLAACIVAEYECRAETLLERQMPRAKELMSQARVSQQDIDRLGCLGDHPGVGAGLDDPKATGRTLQACQKTITTQGAKLADAEVKSQVKCLEKLYVCVQTKPGDGGCLEKADGFCDKARAKLDAARAKFDLAVDKRCGELGFADTLRPPQGANVEALDPSVGTPIDTLDAYRSTVRSQVDCGVEAMLAVTMPRAAEVFGLRQPAEPFPSAPCAGP